MRRAILLLLASAAVAHGQPAPVEDALPGLFFDPRPANAPPTLEPRAGAKDDASGGESLDTPAAQRRIVGIAKDQLARARGQASAGSATQLRLNLLDGVDMTAVIERTAPTSRGYSLAGHIAGMKDVSSVVLVVNGAVVVGDVWTPHGHYTIRAAGGGSYLIEKTDPADRKPLAEPILPPPGSARDTAPTSRDAANQDSGSTIDIFAFWTQGARLGAGGLRNMQALVDLAVAGANEAYLASDIQTRLNLVGATEVHHDHEFTNANTLLERLAAHYDGYMTEVHDVRDAYSSDLVHLFVGPREVTDVGGIAYLWGPFGLSIAGSVGTFVHEVGHNMGLKHDAYQLVSHEGGEEYRRAIEQGLRDDHLRLYGVGYVNQRAFDAGAEEERRWRTIMAYGIQCGDNGLYCGRLLRLSNPRRRWPDDNGDPMGIAEEDAGPDEWPADASRAANENKRTLANWRQRSARCRFDLSGEVIEMPADGGSATMEVGASGASCPWHAVTNEAFVDVAVEGDRVLIRARPNDGPVRSGIVSIAGKPVSLRQLGTCRGPCVCDRAPPVRQAILDATGHTACQDVTALDLAAIGALDLSGRGLDSLSVNDVSHLPNLSELYLSRNGLEDISALSGLANLSVLRLTTNRIEDISALSGLASLRELYLGWNVLEDISALSGLANLSVLRLTTNRIEDISALSGLASLRVLELSGNRIEDISPLSGLANLRELSLGWNVLEDISALKELRVGRLDLSNNAIEDISMLRGMTSLESLYISNNAIKDILALSGLASLRALYLSGNRIEDISALSGLANLASLHLSGNRIEDISALSGLANLVSLHLTGNRIEEISPLSGLANLRILELSGTRIEDISPLSGMTSLRYVHLLNNAIEDISPLLGNTGLGGGDYLNLSGNPLNDESAGAHVSMLRGRGVDVVFSPSIHVEDAVAAEGEALAFRVRLAPAVDRDVKLRWETYSPVTYARPPFAEAGVDYSPAGGEAVVAAGSTETTISVETLRDIVLELDERLFATIWPLDGADETVLFHWLLRDGVGIIKDASNRDVPTGDALSLNVASIFAFLGDAIEYRVTIGDPALVQAFVENGVLRIVPLGDQLGETTVTVLARTPGRSRELAVNVELTDAPAPSWVRGWRLAIPADSGPTSTDEPERTASP